jgi:LysR family transcriptional regulator for bpeEF and oprC
MDTIKAMQAFVGVVDTGGFTSAAALLNMPKATLSACIADLEAHLKVRLLHRTTRKVTVTTEGAAYYERCLRILEDLRDIEESFSSRQASPRGRLRVDVSTAVASRLLMPALHTFFERYPDIELELGCSDRPLNLLSEGVDCALRAGDVIDQSTVVRRVGTMQLVTCATPGYLAERGRPEHPYDLRQHTCLNYFSPRGVESYEWEFSRGGERILLPVSSRLTLNDSNAYVDACLAGLGVGRLPTYMFQQYPQCGALELVMCDWLSDPIPFHVVYPSNRHLSSKVRVFVDWVAEILQHHTGLQMCPHQQAEAERAQREAEAAAEAAMSAAMKAPALG